MDVRTKKTLLIIAAFLCVLLASNLVVVRAVRTGIKTLEEQVVNEQLDRARTALDGRVARLSAELVTWAAWDATYAFTEDLDEHYVEANLADERIESLDIDFILFFDLDGDLRFAKIRSEDDTDQTQYETVSGEELQSGAIPETVRKAFSPKARVLMHASESGNYSGILRLSDGRPLMFSSQPILTSQRSGPSRGTLVFAEYLSDAVLAQLAQSTRSDLRIVPAAGAAGEEELKFANGDIYSGRNWTRASSETTLRGVSLIQDFYKRPYLLIIVDVPRNMAAVGNSIERQITFCLGAICFLFLLMTVILARMRG